MDILSDKIVKTLKPHMCEACNRTFPKGTHMKTAVVASDEITIRRTCPTCTELLTKFGSKFVDEMDDMFHDGCVSDVLEKGQTPEDLLKDMMSNAFDEIIK